MIFFTKKLNQNKKKNLLFVTSFVSGGGAGLD